MAVSLRSDSRDLAEAYDVVSDVQFADGQRLIAKLEVKPGQSVLDIGCGTGRLGRHVMNVIGESGRYVGVDPLIERVNIANEKNEHPNAKYLTGIAEDLDVVADAFIDVVCMNWVFHWVVGKEAAIEEIARVLKPGGRVGIVMPAKELARISGVNQISESVLEREPYRRLVHIEDSSNLKHGLTTSELIYLLMNAGLMVKDVQVKSIKRSFPSAADVMRYLEASFFGNFLNHVPTPLRERAKVDIGAELEKQRTKEGVQFTTGALCAIAQKNEN
jgi:arsenite methyltransferase